MSDALVNDARGDEAAFRPGDGVPIWRWSPPPPVDDTERFHRDCIGLADEYMVRAMPNIPTGIMLWARRGDTWEANPSTGAASVIAELLRRLGALDAC